MRVALCLAIVVAAALPVFGAHAAPPPGAVATTAHPPGAGSHAAIETQAILVTVTLAPVSPATPQAGHPADVGYAVTSTGLGGAAITGQVVATFQGKTLRGPNGAAPPVVTLAPHASSLGRVRIATPVAGDGELVLRFVSRTGCHLGPPGPSGQRQTVCDEQTLAKAETQIHVAAEANLDRDGDGIADALEDALLARYRPYYRFSTNKGDQEPVRPADPIWYIRHASLLTDGDEDSTVRVSNAALQDPRALLTVVPGVGSSSFSATNCKGNFFLNIANDYRSGFHHGDGTDWPAIEARGGIGLYGHVARDPADPGTLRIEYWQFYGYNEVEQALVGNHEADWEGITVLVDAHDPMKSPGSVIHYVHGKPIRFSSVAAAMAGKRYDYAVDGIGPRFILHGSQFAETYDDGLDANEADELAKMQDSVLELYCDHEVECTHPVVYVEYGTHASWPTPQWSFIAVPSHNGQGRHHYLTAPPPNLGESGAPRADTPWSDVILNYNGYWGAFSRGLPGIVDTTPPHGPAQHKLWARPNQGRPSPNCLE